MTYAPTLSSLQASFYTPPDIPRQESSSNRILSSFLRSDFYPDIVLWLKAVNSYLERPNLNFLSEAKPLALGAKHFLDYGGPDFSDFYSQLVGCFNQVYYSTNKRWSRPNILRNS